MFPSFFFSRLLRLILLAFFCGLAPTFSRLAVAQDAETKVPVRSVGRELSFEPVFNGQQGGGKRRGNLVIRAQSEWRRVFSVAISQWKFKPALPEVDFSKQMVVAILLGEQLAIDRGVKILRVVETSGASRALVIEYEATPGATRDAAGMTVTAPSQPFFFIAVPQSTLSVKFSDFTPPALAAAMANTQSPFAGDASAARTGSLSDVAVAGRTSRQSDKEAMVRGDEAGRRFLADATGQNRVALNIAAVLGATFLLWIAQLGLAQLRGGLSPDISPGDEHDSLSATKRFLVPLTAVFAFWALGWALMWGAAGPLSFLGGTPPISDTAARVSVPDMGSLFSTRGFFLAGNSYDVGVGAFWMLQASFAALCVAIALGIWANRLKLGAFLGFCVVMAALIYPIFGHWAWGGGWLQNLGQTSGLGLGCGFVDFAGSGVVHALAGICALAGVLALGRSPQSDARRPLQHSMMIQGAAILGIGIMGATFGATRGIAGDGGLRVGLIAAATLLSGVGGAFAATIYGLIASKDLSPRPITGGFLAGMVAISAGAAFVSPTVALVIGGFGGLLAVIVGPLLESKGYDDASRVVSTHGVAGIWGLLALGIFADGTFGAGWNATFINRQPVPLVGMLYGGSAQLVAQLVGILALGIWAFGAAWLFLMVSSRIFNGLEEMSAVSPHAEAAPDDTQLPTSAPVQNAPIHDLSLANLPVHDTSVSDPFSEPPMVDVRR